MNHKEIAKDIFSKYNDLLNPDIETYNYTEAKDCSFIAIDLISYARKQEGIDWEDVKKEIKNLNI